MKRLVLEIHGDDIIARLHDSRVEAFDQAWRTCLDLDPDTSGPLIQLNLLDNSRHDCPNGWSVRILDV